ncbi:gamma-glutamylcyclotransferase [Lentisalinibacter salinarum]|uniref:gamma-glutamylcyclotransferase n=1 Tax=Lentisalinibacter salinarum TaxID=2992239 RepID=UPI00386FBA01
MAENGKQELWIFGYGSLVWRPDFPHAEAVPAWSEGQQRRFWQASTDHRGTPARPGRVATLAPEPGARCRGVAYRIEAGSRAKVLTYLDHREKNGYLKRTLGIALDDGRRGEAITYVADPAGKHYLGAAPLAEMARQIRISAGPSGPNSEYVLRLAEALRGLGAPEHEEVFTLEALLRRTESGSGA